MRPLWPCVPLLRVSGGCGARGADCDGGVCTGVTAGLKMEGGKYDYFVLCCTCVVVL